VIVALQAAVNTALDNRRFGTHDSDGDGVPPTSSCASERRPEPTARSCDGTGTGSGSGRQEGVSARSARRARSSARAERGPGRTAPSRSSDYAPPRASRPHARAPAASSSRRHAGGSLDLIVQDVSGPATRLPRHHGDGEGHDAGRPPDLASRSPSASRPPSSRRGDPDDTASNWVSSPNARSATGTFFLQRGAETGGSIRTRAPASSPAPLLGGLGSRSSASSRRRPLGLADVLERPVISGTSPRNWFTSVPGADSRFQGPDFKSRPRSLQRDSSSDDHLALDDRGSWRSFERLEPAEARSRRS